MAQKAAPYYAARCLALPGAMLAVVVQGVLGGYQKLWVLCLLALLRAGLEYVKFHSRRLGPSPTIP